MTNEEKIELMSIWDKNIKRFGSLTEGIDNKQWETLKNFNFYDIKLQFKKLNNSNTHIIGYWNNNRFYIISQQKIDLTKINFDGIGIDNKLIEDFFNIVLDDSITHNYKLKIYEKTTLINGYSIYLLLKDTVEAVGVHVNKNSELISACRFHYRFKDVNGKINFIANKTYKKNYKNSIQEMHEYIQSREDKNAANFRKH